jgi:hypothetical protein
VTKGWALLWAGGGLVTLAGAALLVIGWAIWSPAPGICGIALLFGGLLSLRVIRLMRAAANRQHSAATPRQPASDLAPTAREVEVGPVLRPRIGWVFLSRYVRGLLPLLVLVAITSHNSAPATWTSAGALVMASIVAMLVAMRTSRLSWDTAGLTWVDALGRERRFRRAAIATGQRYSTADLFGSRLYLSFRGHDGGELFKVLASYWGPSRLDAFCARMGVRLTGSYDDVVRVSLTRGPGLSVGEAILGAVLVAVALLAFVFLRTTR